MAHHLKGDIGFHLSFKGKNYVKNLEEYVAHCNARQVQVYLKGPRSYRNATISQKNLDGCREFCERTGFKLFSHAPVIINMANDWSPEDKHVLSAIDDIRTATKIGAVGSVFHVGKSKNNDINKCLDNKEAFIRHVLSETEVVERGSEETEVVERGSEETEVVERGSEETEVVERSSMFILETGAGQGTEMCVSIEAFAEFYGRFSEVDRERFRLCVDTCHIFSAGYDIGTVEGAQEYIDRFEELIGWKYVALIHLNDSKTCCGSRVDRHENIGFGKIGIPGLTHFVDFSIKSDIPIVLETKTDYLEVIDEIALVDKLVQNSNEN